MKGGSLPVLVQRLAVEKALSESDMRNEEVIKLKDVAMLLKVSEKTVYSMAQNGELPAFKVRGQWRFSRNDLDAWIEKLKHTTQDLGEKGQQQ